MPSLNDLNSVALRLLGNMVTGTPPVTAVNGVGAATFKTTNAIIHLNNGKLKSRAALSAVALAAPTTSTTKTTGETMTQAEVDAWRLYTVPAGSIAYIVLALDGASTPNAVAFQGGYDGQDLAFRGGGVSKGKSVIPDIPAGFVPFAVIKLAYASAFVPGTTALDVAGVSFTDVGVLPVGTTL